jgi:Domain of unknown function (DUF4401)
MVTGRTGMTEQAEITTSSSPWYIKLILGISAWLSAGLIFGWLIDMLWGNAPIQIFFGGCTLAAAIYLKSKTSNIFINQLSFALSAIGQVAILSGLGDFINSTEGFLLMLIVVETIMLFVFYDVFHQFISTAMVVIAGGILLGVLEAQVLVYPYIALVAICFSVLKHQKRIAIATSLSRAIDFAVPLCVVCMLLFSDINPDMRYFQIGQWFTAVSLTGLLLIEASTVLKKLKIPWLSTQGLVIGGTVLALCVLGFTVPSLVASFLYISLAFREKNKPLIGLMILSVLISFSYYYYQLHYTLLEKSLLLFCVGASLLVFRGIFMLMQPKE